MHGGSAILICVHQIMLTGNPQKNARVYVCPHPGQRKVVPHLHIPGVTPVPPRFLVAHAKRRSLKLAVACCLSGGVYIQEVTGTDYEGHTLQPGFIGAAGKPHRSMGAEEYCDFLQRAWSHFNQSKSFQRRNQQAMLVHDRSTTHVNHVVKTQLKSLNLCEELLPPRSPDLQPLDYGVFSTSKNKLERESQRHDDWTKRALDLEKHIREAPFANIVAEFPKRLQACIRAGGQHIDRELKAVQHGHTIV